MHAQSFTLSTCLAITRRPRPTQRSKLATDGRSTGRKDDAPFLTGRYASHRGDEFFSFFLLLVHQIMNALHMSPFLAMVTLSLLGLDPLSLISMLDVGTCK